MKIILMWDGIIAMSLAGPKPRPEVHRHNIMAAGRWVSLLILDSSYAAVMVPLWNSTEFEFSLDTHWVKRGNRLEIICSGSGAAAWLAKFITYL